MLSLIAVPLSRVDPRQGRFSKLVPATLLYAVYYVSLQMGMNLLGEGAISATVGLWWAHVLFGGFGLVLLFGIPGRRRRT